MAKKRFTDIEIWDKEWYMDLTPTLKCLMKYIFDKCDASGCWKPNWKLASIHINDTVDLNDLKKLPQDQYEVLENGKIFIPDFINFQYGKLSKNSPAHNCVFIALEKNNLQNRAFNRVGYSLQDKDKDKDKEIEKDKEEYNGEIQNKIDLPKKENSDYVCYDVEEYVLGNQKLFEKICIATGKKDNEVKKELHLYHLWLTKNEKYPFGKKPAAAGLESWLHNGSSFKNNFKSNESSDKKMVV